MLCGPTQRQWKGPRNGGLLCHWETGSAAVAVRIARQAVLDTMPGILHRFLGFLPGQARLALCAVPALLESRFGVGIPVRTRRQAARLCAIAIRRAVVLEVEV